MPVLLPCPICDSRAVAAPWVAHSKQLVPRRCVNCTSLYRAVAETQDGETAVTILTKPDGAPLPNTTSAPRAPIYVECPACTPTTEVRAKVPYGRRHRLANCPNCGVYLRLPEDVQPGDCVSGVPCDVTGVELKTP